MGVGFQDILKMARDNRASRFLVNIVTNQDTLNGGPPVISWATGLVQYQPALRVKLPHGVLGPVLIPEAFVAPSLDGNTDALTYLFSDRTPDGTQPFANNKADLIGLSLTPHSNGDVLVEFTLLSWGNPTFTIVAKPVANNILLGYGPPIGGNTSSDAAYIFSVSLEP